MDSLYEVELPRKLDYFSSDIIRYQNQILTEASLNRIELLHEAEVPQSNPLRNNIKERLVEMFEKLLSTIQNLATKFANVSSSLVKRNTEWLKTLGATAQAGAATRNSSFPESVPDNFSFQIAPYWDTLNRVINFRIPEFQDSPSFLESLKDPEEFRRKHFSQMYFRQTNDKDFFNAKEYFLGDKVVTIGRQQFISVYPRMINFLSTYDSIVRPINDRNNKIINVLRTATNKLKSTVFRESTESNDLTKQMFLIMEAQGPATSSDEHKASDPNRTDKREDNDNSRSSGQKEEFDAKASYTRIVYQINAARMLVLEQAYDQYVKCIADAYSKSKGSKNVGAKPNQGQEKETGK